MNIKSAFKTAWKDFKGGLSKVDVFLQANEPAIQAEVKTGVSVAESIDPALTPALTAGDALEEAGMAELLTAVHTGSALVNGATGTATVTLSAELYGALKGLLSILTGHPAVVAASTPAK